MEKKCRARKKGSSKTISGRFASLFRRFAEERWPVRVRALSLFFLPSLLPNKASSWPRRDACICLRWVYLRTKWFLFGPRASCASHGGFVAVAACRKRMRRANKSKDAPRVGGELLYTSPPPPWPLSTFPRILLFACARPSVRVYVRACVRST